MEEANGKDNKAENMNVEDYLWTSETSRGGNLSYLERGLLYKRTVGIKHNWVVGVTMESSQESKRMVSQDYP